MRAARYILHRVSSSSSQDTQPMFTYVREDFHVRGTRVSRVKIVRTQILSSGYAELRDACQSSPMRMPVVRSHSTQTRTKRLRNS